MTNIQKATWLQEHHKNYSLKWYLENEARLNAMFAKAYKAYMQSLNSRATRVQQEYIDELGQRMRQAYHTVYGSDFDSDMRVDRSGTNRKVQAIRSMWVAQPA